VNKHFSPLKALDYTVEAGKPDILDFDKIKCIKDYHVSRISINPQTLNDDTLKRIGRSHGSKAFYEAFDMARSLGHDNINCDLIAGLPGENFSDFKYSFDGICSLSPESITVHSLVIKRASAIRENLNNEALSLDNAISFYKKRSSDMDKMIAYSIEKAGDKYKPYYMYRQKNADAHFGSTGQENIGFSITGMECLYNILMMEEKQTIYAAGAGASTKYYDKKSKTVSRSENVKSLMDYCNKKIL
jgi:oxygen-independent coproporphyrinogen-3 oxidase